VYTYLKVSEDNIALFGFLTRDELDMFKKLINVSGVGPKGAVAILSALDIDSLCMAIISQDAKAISKAQGIGNKTAQRIIIELKDKVDLPGLPGEAAEIAGEGNLSSGSDAVDALIALGYSRSEALKAVTSVNGAAGMDTEELLRMALRKL